MYSYKLLAIVLTTSFALPAAAAPQEWTLDRGHSYIGWRIDHFGLSDTIGQFRSYDGSFMLDPEQLEKGDISFSIDVESIDSNHAGRDNHLRSTEFFDVAAFPAIEFKSTSIELKDEKYGVIEGDLTLKGKTNRFSLEFEITDKSEFAEFLPRYDSLPVMGVEARGTFNRLDYGFDMLDFEGSPIGKEVALDLHFDLVNCNVAGDDNIPCNWGRNTSMEFPNE